LKANLYRIKPEHLWKTYRNITTTSVKEDFEKISTDINAKIPLAKEKIKIERCVTINFSKWDAITGEKH